MPITDQIKPARIDDIRRSDSMDLYVLNNSAQIRGMRDGLLIFNVAINANDQRIIRIPNTWIPINIGLQVPKDLILRSPEFLDAVMRRVIILVSGEDAERIFEEDGEAKTELDRVVQDMNSRFSMDTPDDPPLPKNLTDMQSVEGALDPDINPQLAEAVLREDVSEGELNSLVRRLSEHGALKRKDFDFILSNCAFEKIRSIATDRLAKLPRNQGRMPRMN